MRGCLKKLKPFVATISSANWKRLNYWMLVSSFH